MNFIVEEIDVQHDARGFVFEPLYPDTISDQRNVHVVVTQPGCIRGNHYHEKGTEAITVFGPTLVRFRDQQKVQEMTVHENQAIRFTIPPRISHAFKNIGSKPTFLIAFNTMPHDKREPDTIRDMLIEI